MAQINLLDGGMGQELIHRAGDSPTPLWSTQVMMDLPGLVQQVHADYFAAGATIATTNTYAILRDRLVRAGIEDRIETLYAAALAEAKAACPPGKRIAGAIGPLGASYRPDLHPPHDMAVAAYAEIAGLLAPGVDLILCESIASLAHARAVLEAALQVGKPVWLACTLDDADGSRLRSGEPVSEVLPIAAQGAAAILANCSVPEAMPAALAEFAKGDLPFGAYANGFAGISDGFLQEAPTADALDARADMGPAAYAAHVMKWVRMGATIVGGCCETGPAHIAEIARCLTAAGHEII